MPSADDFMPTVDDFVPYCTVYTTDALSATPKYACDVVAEPEDALADLGSVDLMDSELMQPALPVAAVSAKSATKMLAKVPQLANKRLAIKVIRGMLRPQKKTAFGLPGQESPRASSPSNLRISVMKVLKFYETKYINDGSYESIVAAASRFITKHALEDTTFYVYNLGEVYRLFYTWRTVLPRVTPFYAVKCNPDPGILSMLYALGAGFDCASVQELDRVLAMGVPQSRMIFANPCKKNADFAYANKKGVEFTTFDCISELEKIAASKPDFKCVLRIRCDDDSAHINLGLKYGAEREDIPLLLEAAKALGLSVHGVSFHVGSGCKNPGVYETAIETARYAFDTAELLGFPSMELLDIGGGYTAPRDERTWRLFHSFAAVINESIDRYFPPAMGVRIISEPGQYFAETTATLFTSVLGHKHGASAEGGNNSEYWLSDGCFGSFRIPVVVDGLQLPCKVLRSPLLAAPAASEDATVMPSTLWGPSPDPADCVHRCAQLPVLRNGDFVVWHHAGAYTVAAAGNFSGIKSAQPQKLYLFAKDVVHGGKCMMDSMAA